MSANEEDIYTVALIMMVESLQLWLGVFIQNYG